MVKSLLTLTIALSLVSMGSVYAESGIYGILDYDLDYDIENGELLAMDLDVDFTSLIVEIVSYDDGFVELDIPRGLLDATFDGEDDVFFVLIDGTESEYVEVDSSTTVRSLIIPFFTSDQEIEILGTKVLSSNPIPVEFVEELEITEPVKEEPLKEKVVEPIQQTTETKNTDAKGGGCLIATAAYGTELAPQVQFLREIRDNTVMSTSSGAAFMSGFNQLYYSFSPTIADMERENPMFQEAVRAFITPMISTLSIMTLADDGNDAQVLGLGISVITLNLGMYIVAPTVAGFAVHRRYKSKN